MSQDSNPREGYGFSMLAGQFFGRIYSHFFVGLLVCWAVLWTVTGAFAFSLAFFFPICIGIGIGWMFLEAWLYALLMVMKDADAKIKFIVAERGNGEKIEKELEKVREMFEACKSQKPGDEDDLKELAQKHSGRVILGRTLFIQYAPPSEAEIANQRPHLTTQRRKKLQRAIERSVDARDRFFACWPTKVVRWLGDLSNFITPALWWLGDNERPRGSQLSTSFGLSLLLHGCYAPLRKRVRTLKTIGITNAGTSSPQASFTTSTFSPAVFQASADTGSRHVTFSPAVFQASADTGSRHVSSGLLIPSPPASPPANLAFESAPPQLFRLGTSRLAQVLKISSQSSLDALDKEAGLDASDHFVFSAEDIGKHVRIRRGAIRVSAGEQPGMCSRWHVRLAAWDPERLLPRQQQYYHELDGEITQVTDGKVIGITHSERSLEENDFAFDNPRRAYRAVFSRLLFQIALPILIVAPMALYGTITAFYTYRAFQSSDAFAINTVCCSQDSLVRFLYVETCRMFIPPHQFRLPDISLLFVIDPEQILETLRELPSLISALLQTWADYFALLQFDPIYFLEGSRAMLRLNLLVAILKPATSYMSKLMVRKCC